MDTGETDFEDITYDLISARFRLLRTGYDYWRYMRDADRVGRPDIAEFFRRAIAEDSARAVRCYEFLTELGVGEPAGVHNVPARRDTSASSRRWQ